MIYNLQHLEFTPRKKLEWDDAIHNFFYKRPPKQYNWNIVELVGRFITHCVPKSSIQWRMHDVEVGGIL